MFFIDSLKMQPDVAAYKKAITGKKFIHFSHKLLSKYYELSLARCDSLKEFLLDIVEYESGRKLYTLKRDSIIDYLLDYAGCPEAYLRKGRDKLSIEQKKLQVALSNGIAKNFLPLYMEYASLIKINGGLRNILENCKPDGNAYCQGDPLSELHYNVNVAVNMRFNYKNYAIISSIPKTCASCICAEDDYVLVWGDFAQSDLRIGYNTLMRDESNIEIMNRYEDKYESLARLIDQLNDKDFDLDSFRSERNLYKVYVLETMYGTRKARIPQETQFVEKLVNFLEKCPKYKDYSSTLDTYLELGIPVYTKSYFGHEQMNQAKGSYNNAIKNFCLNAPIQTGSSEVVIILVNAILDRFYSMGYSEDEVSTYMVRHDEPVFKVHKRVLKDLWVFANFSDVFVDDWMPLRVDFHVGYHYNKIDEDLENCFKQSIEQNKSHMNVDLSGFSPARKSALYRPAPLVLSMSVWCDTIDDDTFVVFYEDSSQAAEFFRFPTANAEEIQQGIMKKAREYVEKFSAVGYRHAVFYNPVLDSECSVGDSIVRFFQCSNYRNATASDLCSKLCNTMLKNSGVEEDDLPYGSSGFLSDAVFISVKDRLAGLKADFDGQLEPAEYYSLDDYYGDQEKEGSVQ